MKLKEGIYYNAKYDSIVEILAILPNEVGGGYTLLFDMGDGRYFLAFKNITVIESDTIVFLGKV